MKRSFGVIGALLIGLGCSDPKHMTGPSIERDPARIYARLELSYHAITLSTMSGLDTMTLQATPWTPTGAVLVTDAHTPVTTFRVDGNDPALTVTSDGRLTAHTVSSAIFVIATSTIGSVTQSDTAVVRITDEFAPSPAAITLSIQPLLGDSAKVDCSRRATDTLTARGLDADQHEIGIPVFASYRSSDVTRATIDINGVVQGLQPGNVMMYADAYMYGHGMRDSIRYTIGYPLVQTIWAMSKQTLSSGAPMTYLTPRDVVIGVGGVVHWINASNTPFDIVFDRANNVSPSVGAMGIISTITGALTLIFDACPAQQGGNVPALEAAPARGTFFTVLPCPNVAARLFSRAGVYPFRSTLTGVAGRVVVQ